MTINLNYELARPFKDIIDDYFNGTRADVLMATCKISNQFGANPSREGQEKIVGDKIKFVEYFIKAYMKQQSSHNVRNQCSGARQAVVHYSPLAASLGFSTGAVAGIIYAIQYLVATETNDCTTISNQADESAEGQESCHGMSIAMVSMALALTIMLSLIANCSFGRRLSRTWRPSFDRPNQQLTAIADILQNTSTAEILSHINSLKYLHNKSLQLDFSMRQHAVPQDQANSLQEPLVSQGALIRYQQLQNNQAADAKIQRLLDIFDKLEALFPDWGKLRAANVAIDMPVPPPTAPSPLMLHGPA